MPGVFVSQMFQGGRENGTVKMAGAKECDKFLKK